MKLIELRNIKKFIKDELILKDINLEVNEGDFISIIGASGSGKSTLLYIAGLLDSPSEGEVIFRGEKIDPKDEKKISTLRNKHIGFVFQFHYLINELNALDNVILPMIKAGTGREEAEQRALKLLESVGLKGKEKRKPYMISGGEAQRVAIARALANNPDVIMADEPTGNLDSKNTNLVMELFLDLNIQGVTIIMVTHEYDLAKRTNRIVEMLDGMIIRSFTP